MAKPTPKQPKRFTALSIPGRNYEDAASWFVFDRQANREVAEATDFEAARAEARKLNAEAK